METVKKRGLIFKLVFSFFLLIFLFSTFFHSVDVPDPSEFFYALFSPFESSVSPIADWLDGLKAIGNFISGGSLPSFNDLLNLFVMPFQVLANVIMALIEIIGNLVELFV